MMLALLGTAAPSALRTWLSRLGDGGRVADDLQTRPWAHPTGKSSTVTVSTGSSGSRATIATERLVGAPTSLAARRPALLCSHSATSCHTAAGSLRQTLGGWVRMMA